MATTADGDLETPDADARRDWHSAAGKGDLARLRALLASPSATEALASEALGCAAIYGKLEAAVLLLAHGANPNWRNRDWDPALFSVRAGGLPMVELLLSHGADVHARAADCVDVLFNYLRDVSLSNGRGGKVEVARRLLDAGLDIRGGPHALVACRTRVPALLELVLAAGADPNATNNDGNAIFAIGSLPGRAGMLAALVRGGMDPNTRSGDTTLLAEVCREGDLGSAMTLLERGADCDARAVAAAKDSGNAVLVDFLLEHGAPSLTPVLEPAAAQTLDVAEEAARARPSDGRARLELASALLGAGFRAAAGSEVAAAKALGVPMPDALASGLGFERPAGTRWTLCEMAAPADVTPRTADEHFPGAQVTDGARTLPLVVVLGTPCQQCDERGEEECSLCRGTGTRPSIFDPDEDLDCAPWQRCQACRGLKFVIVGKRLGKGTCQHPRVETELQVPPFAFWRCADCGLLGVRGPIYPAWSESDAWACGLCGRFDCHCA